MAESSRPEVRGPAGQIAEWLALARRQHQAGRLAEAEPLYRQILAADPNHAETLHLFGVLARQVGRNDVAAQLIGKAISIGPPSPGLYVDLASPLKALGRFEEAAAACRRAIDLQPDHAAAHGNLGGALLALGRPDEAAAACQRAIAVKPDFAEAYGNLGDASMAVGRFDEAAAAFQRCIDLKPNLVHAHLDLGRARQASGRADEAVASFRRAIDLKPDFAEAHSILGIALEAQGRREEAVASYRRAIALAPGLAEAHNNLGLVLGALGQVQEAVASCQRAVDLSPGFAEAHNSLGVVLRAAGQLEAAAASCRQAIALKPDHAMAHYNLGALLQDLGRLDEAAAAFERAIDLKPDHAMALNSLARLRPMSGGPAEAEVAFALLSQQVDRLDEFGAKDRSLLLFAMSKALEDRGEVDRAFACMAEANAIARTDLSFDIGEAERLMAGVAEAFDGPLLRRLKGAGPTDDRPIFIVGMPRSGSTLIEQIISAHPAVRGAGEIDNFARAIAIVKDGSVYPSWAQAMTGKDCAAIGQAYLCSLPAVAPGETRITDKQVYNFLNLGLIHLCLPNATIIHCQRDPRDVGLSCFAIPFNDGQEFAFDLMELGRYWRAYDRLMAHWRAALPPGRMLEVPYEAVVADFEGWARRLIAHCGLDWDDACLRFYESKREVRTASSAQVRQPIYAASVGRWRPFAGHLGPLLDALGEPWASETINDEGKKR